VPEIGGVVGNTENAAKRGDWSRGGIGVWSWNWTGVVLWLPHLN